MTISISIILPNLNHLKFLPDRIKSITSQTLDDWECIVIDGFSDDGSWEYLKKCAGSDKRFRLYQTPRKGAYDAWNKGISKAKGKYIYIATSDDTMEPTCLKVMFDALECYRQCQIAHCCLTLIDEDGLTKENQWNQWSNVKFFGDLIQKKHIRYAPHDVFVHGGWSTVYTSVTQLLISKELFHEIGLFRTDLGAVADFEWGLRAAFIANIVHIPEYLATWRKHPEQLTDSKFGNSKEFSAQVCKMIQLAYETVGHKTNEIKENDIYNLMYVYRRQFLSRSHNWFNLLQCVKLYVNTYPIHRHATIDRIINMLSLSTVKKLKINKYIESLIHNYNNKRPLIEIVK